jgi:hypothetical protein
MWPSILAVIVAPIRFAFFIPSARPQALAATSPAMQGNNDLIVRPIARSKRLDWVSPGGWGRNIRKRRARALREDLTH